MPKGYPKNPKQKQPIVLATLKQKPVEVEQPIVEAEPAEQETKSVTFWGDRTSHVSMWGVRGKEPYFIQFINGYYFASDPDEIAFLRIVAKQPGSSVREQ